MIIGDNYPTNARYLNKLKEIPNKTREDLIAKAQTLNNIRSSIPSGIPRSIADRIGQLTNDIARQITNITNFVDSIITTVRDIQKAIFRAFGLIKHCQNKLREYKSFLGSFRPFDQQQALTGKYAGAGFLTKQIAFASSLTSLLAVLRARLKELAPNIPLNRHLIKGNDTLQKVSIEFYGVADHWKAIYDYNKLTSTKLNIGTILEIPKL